MGVEEGRRLGGSPLLSGVRSLRLAGPHSWDAMRPLLQPMRELRSLWLEGVQLPFPSRWGGEAGRGARLPLQPSTV